MNKTLTKIITAVAVYTASVGLVMNYKHNSDLEFERNTSKYYDVGNTLNLEKYHLDKWENSKSSLERKCLDAKFEDLPKLKQKLTYDPDESGRTKGSMLIGFEFDREELNKYKKQIGVEDLISSLVLYKDGKEKMSGNGIIGVHTSVIGYNDNWKEHTYQAVAKFSNGKIIKSDKLRFTINGFEITNK